MDFCFIEKGLQWSNCVYNSMGGAWQEMSKIYSLCRTALVQYTLLVYIFTVVGCMSCIVSTFWANDPLCICRGEKVGISSEFQIIEQLK